MTASVATGLDHPVIAVGDMPAARAAYERLGFTIPPRGSHVEWGTGNWCIMFERDYIELRGVIKPGQTHNLGEFLARHGEGLMGVALATEDADASRWLLAQRGIHAQPVQSLTRNFELPEGWVQPRFTLCFLGPDDTYGLMSVVLCQHLTPQLLRRPAWLEHLNGAYGVASVTGVVQDLDRAASTHRRLFGEYAVCRGEHDVHIQTGGGAIILATPETVRHRFPAAKPAPSPEPALVSLAIWVHNLAGAADLLASRGVKFNRSHRSVFVAPTEACGVVLEFIERESAQE